MKRLRAIWGGLFHRLNVTTRKDASGMPTVPMELIYDGTMSGMRVVLEVDPGWLLAHLGEKACGNKERSASALNGAVRARVVEVFDVTSQEATDAAGTISSRFAANARLAESYAIHLQPVGLPIATHPSVQADIRRHTPKRY